MASLEDLERRIERVEDEQRETRLRDMTLRSEVGAAVSIASDASRLATGTSVELTDYQRDQREAWRANTRVLGALRDTQIEQGEKIEANFAEVKADIAELKLGMTSIVDMLTEIIRRDNEGPSETPSPSQ